MFLSTILHVEAQTPRADEADVESRTRVVMLGTGNPYPDPERGGPATAIVVDSTAYLVDFGVGVVRSWNRALQKDIKGIPLWGLRTAFVTHLHSDHTLGYAELILSSWTIANSELAPLKVFGPVGLSSMTENILDAYAEDIGVRTSPVGELPGRSPPVVQAHEINPGIVYRDSLVTVTAFAVHHGSWRQAFGYRFETPDKVVVISGDVGSPSVIPDVCSGCDILIHEAALPEGPAVNAYYRSYHTTAEQLAALATRSRPKLLVVYHQRGGNVPGQVLAAIRANYAGNVVMARDGDVYR